MENDTLDPIVADVVFRELMTTLGAKPRVTSPKEYHELELDEECETRLDHLEQILTEIARDYGFRYERPYLTQDGKKLLARTLTGFIKRYAFDLRDSMRSAMPGFVCI